jgi:hypothetical protein
MPLAEQGNSISAHLSCSTMDVVEHNSFQVDRNCEVHRAVLTKHEAFSQIQ